ncbi:tight adherence protein B [Motilibacter peucedani]|uniref:Tight adherence protein B n=1 Tax=Motilibacter peucedani TaxID=598650 RepID=A0A420XQ23_9ACTN|nr:type II secretion system F family protein [Motilibacter peucedani]RKS75359.1 tight adherence protein B [Motilibacter peucedani]
MSAPFAPLEVRLLVAACGTCVAAGAVLLGSGSPARLRRVVPAAAIPASSRPPAAAAGGVAALVVLVLLSGVPAALVTCAVALLVVVLRRRAVRHRAVEQRRAAVQAGTTALAAALRAGLPAHAAWREAAGATDDAGGADLLLATSRAPVVGADVAEELLMAARRAGAEGLGRVAVCWRVGSGAGAGLAASLDVVSDGLQADQALRRQVALELAAPRATARVLAVLPLAGAGLGAAAGARPWEVLLLTRLGHACLAVGTALAVAGLGWVEALARRAQPR